MIAVDKEIELYTVANGVPWVYLERERRGKRGSRNIVWLFLAADGSQRARLPSPRMLASLPSCRMILPNVFPSVPYRCRVKPNTVVRVVRSS